MDSWPLLLTVVGGIVLLGGGVTLLVVLLVRRSDGAAQGPVGRLPAARGDAEHAQARLAAAEARVQADTRGLEPPAPAP